MNEYYFKDEKKLFLKIRNFLYVIFNWMIFLAWKFAL